MFCRLHCHFFDNYKENMMSIRENAELFWAFHKDLLILLIKRYWMCIHEERLSNLLLCEWILKIELNLFVGIHWFLTLELAECLLIFFIENIVNKNVIESDYALKIMLYTISLSTQKDVINPSANRLRKCFSHNSLIVNMFFFHSPNNTWVSDTINGDRVACSSDSDVKMQGVILFGAKIAHCL